MTRAEYVAAVVFTLGWLVAWLTLTNLVPLIGRLSLTLYQLYGVAATLGWLTGNLFVSRMRYVDPELKRWPFVLLYLLGPPSVIGLVRALAPWEAQRAAPLVPVFATLVYVIFFLVPVSFRRMQKPPRRPQIGGR